jgi:predicted transcriptional regulator
MTTMMKFGLKAIGAFLLALLTWELILDLTFYRTPGTHIHSQLGKIYNKGILIWGKEGYSISQMNSFGIRGEEIEALKPNEFRILSLGDSFTEALQVSLDQTYSKQLETLLNTNKASAATHYTVINAGRSGSSPAEFVYLADYLNEQFDPHYVIICINDLDFVLDLLNDKDRAIYVKRDSTGYRIYKDETFISKNQIKQRLPQLAFLGNYSSIRIAVESIQSMIKPQSHDTGNEDILTGDHSRYAELMDWIFQLLKTKYKHLVFLYVPEFDYKKYTGPSKYETLMQFYAQKHEIKMLNITTDIVELFNTHKQPSHGFNNSIPGRGHLNEIGHRIAAEKLATYFKEEVIQ